MFLIVRSEKSPIPSKRISNITEFLTFEVYKFAARGLYEKDKFMFTLLLALKIDMGKGIVKPDEFSCLIKGNSHVYIGLIRIFVVVVVVAPLNTQ